MLPPHAEFLRFLQANTINICNYTCPYSVKLNISHSYSFILKTSSYYLTTYY